MPPERIVIRKAAPSAENSPTAKLDWDEVREIRREAKASPGKPNISKIARERGLNPGTIRLILEGKTWKE